MTGDMERDSSNQGFEFDSYGVSFGFDNQLNENLVLGVGLGYAESDVDFDTAGQSTDMDSYHVGVYTTYSTDKFYLDGALHYADNSYDSQRLEMGTGLKALSDTDANEWGAFLGAGYTVVETDTLYFTPTISVAGAHAKVDGFAEKGALMNQVISGYDADSLATTVGFRFGGKLGAQGNIRPEFRLGWAHEFGDTERDIVGSLAGSDSSFVITGRELEKNSVMMGLGLDARLNEKLAVYVDYDGEYQDDFDSHALSVGLRYFF
jgi:outer membrane autotransporter protein